MALAGKGTQVCEIQGALSAGAVDPGGCHPPQARGGGCYYWAVPLLGGSVMAVSPRGHCLA